MKRLLIVGLGNPGAAYEVTRHNMGCLIIRFIAKNLGWVWKKDGHIKGEYATGTTDGKEVTLLFPTTFMNNSGLAVGRMMELLHVGLEEILIVTDDVYIPFGEFRLRKKGSAAGHNGVQSVIDHLLSSEFARLKVGIGAPHLESLEEFVLGAYSEEELKQIPDIAIKAEALINGWIKGE